MASSFSRGGAAAGSITDAAIAPNAAIARSKLSFGRGLVNADIASGAAIAVSKVLFSSDVTYDENRQLVLTANTPTGGISKLIRFKMTTDEDRPWMAWYDPANRLRAAVGFHTHDIVGGDWHNAYEVKTDTNPASATPLDMRTRLSIGTGDFRTLVAFPFVTFVEAQQGENVPNTAFGFRLRAVESTGVSNVVIGNLLAQLDGSDNTTVYLDAMGVTSGKGAQIVMFRNTSSTSASNPSFRIKKGDGTNTDVFALVTGGNSAAPTLTLYDAAAQGFNINTGTQTGLKIGTATTQKLAFFNRTPIVQPGAISSPTADVTALKTAVDAIRTALTNLGLTA